MRYVVVALAMLGIAGLGCSSRPSAARQDAGRDASSIEDGGAGDVGASDGGGVDGGLAMDSGPRDGGGRDGGHDAGRMDAGARDGGRDAGARDAGGDAGPRPDAGARCIGGAHVGLYATDDFPAHTSVRDFLVPTGVLGPVTIGGPLMDAPGVPARVPTLDELLAYDALFVWGSGAWNGDAIGDVLADYVDAGGGVVIAVFAQRMGSSVGVAGRMDRDHYLPYVPGDYMFLSLTLGTVSVPTSPIMTGVMSVRGTGAAVHEGTIAAGSTLIASWSDGHPLVATLEPSNGRTALLGFYPVRFWDTASDGARLMANTLLWAARCP